MAGDIFGDSQPGGYAHDARPSCRQSESVNPFAMTRRIAVALPFLLAVAVELGTKSAKEIDRDEEL